MGQIGGSHKWEGICGPYRHWGHPFSRHAAIWLFHFFGFFSFCNIVYSNHKYISGYDIFTYSNQILHTFLLNLIKYTSLVILIGFFCKRKFRKYFSQSRLFENKIKTFLWNSKLPIWLNWLKICKILVWIKPECHIF